MAKNTGKPKVKKKITGRMEDCGAAVIFWYDRVSVKAEAYIMAKLALMAASIMGFVQRLEDRAAVIVEKHDILCLRVDRLLLIINYKISKQLYSSKAKFMMKKKKLLSHFAGILLVALAVVALFSYTTGYSYSYNGRLLGYIQNQEEVLKVLNLVSDELSREYGTSIEIDKDKDIRFEISYIMDKDVDDVNDVLKRFTYMSDMQTKGFEIRIDGKSYAICESEKVANDVLEAIKDKYSEKKPNRTYEKIRFKEKVEITEVETKLAQICSKDKAIRNIEDGGTKEKVYTVKTGDTYYGITEKLGISFKELKKYNPEIDEDELYPGDKLKMNKAVSALTVVTVETSEFSEKLKRDVVYRKTNDLYEGDRRVVQKGSDGKQLITAKITRENGEIVKRKDIKKEILQDSVDKIILKGTKVRPKTAPTGSFINPVPSAMVTSPFGWRWGRLHEGIDLATSVGTPIRASDGGTVISAGWYGGYGLCVEIQHGGGTITRYGHCNDVYVSVGDQVYQGETIAALGNTGYSTGPHCHFEIRVNGTAVDPADYI